MAVDIPNPVFSAFAFISFVACMIPLPWHLEAWNVGTCAYMIWTALAALNTFINSVVWNSNTTNWAPVWCDISSQIIIATSIAIPASSLCINRRLYQIASVQSVTTTRAQKRRDIMVDLAISVGIPLLELALHPIVQAHRFVIYEEVGCWPFTFNTPASYPLYILWPIFIGLVSAFYCFLTIRQLAIRRAQFKEFLSTNKNLSSTRYFRLMGLAGIEVLLTVPLASFGVYLNLTGSPLQAWDSWSNAHADFDLIYTIPSEEWQATPLSTAGVELSRWSVVLCAAVFFAFFGFADEARRNYRLAYESVAKRVGLSTGTMTGIWTSNGTYSDNSRSITLPVHITQQTEKKRDSFASFSSRMSLPDLGGALADVKKGGPFTPTTTMSASLSRESLPRSPVDLDNVPLPTLPEAMLDSSAPPRYTPDVMDTPRAV